MNKIIYITLTIILFSLPATLFADKSCADKISTKSETVKGANEVTVVYQCGGDSKHVGKKFTYKHTDKWILQWDKETWKSGKKDVEKGSHLNGMINKTCKCKN
ncbi:MAG: hypothetical protein GY781_07135 [Gammaproteobacteria bacterium]|nr:hypothetical protein [Gammaproteobacteria bacterium]